MTLRIDADHDAGTVGRELMPRLGPSGSLAVRVSTDAFPRAGGAHTGITRVAQNVSRQAWGCSLAR